MREGGRHVRRRAAVLVLAGVYGASLAADLLAPSYETQYREAAAAPPSARFPLGTDELGRDRLARLLHGSRVSLLLAPAAALVSTLWAAAIGALAGYLHGAWKALLCRAIDLVLSLPWLFLLLTVRAALPLNVGPAASVVVTFALLGCLGWAAPARLVSAAVSGLAFSDCLLQARATGAGGLRLFVRHVLPQVRPVLAAQFLLAVPVFILGEANLGMLGLGVAEPLPSWGGLLRELDTLPALVDAPAALAAVLAPAALLAAVVTCFHCILPEEPRP